MRIDIPHPQPRESGDYQFYVVSGYGDPHGTIWLDETQCLTLSCLTAEDCDRLIRAADQVKDQILGYTAEMTVPHGTKHLYKGTCQLCGKPEDDGLHAEPAPETVPWPTGLCGHTVTPGAWSHGFTRCRDCLTGTTPDSVSWYDRATAGEQLDRAAS